MKVYLLKYNTYDMCNRKFYDDIEVYASYESALKRKEELINSDYWGYYKDSIEIEKTEIEGFDDNVLFYKGCYTEIQYCANTKTLYGKVENLLDSIEFESDTCKGIEEEFHKAVDEYLKIVEETKKGE